MNEILDEAERIFAAREILETPFRRARSEGIGPLYRYLAHADAPMSSDLSRALFASPRLRRDLAALRNRINHMPIPVQAAASDGALDRREIAGGEIVMSQDRTRPQVYFLVRLTDAAGEAEGAQYHVIFFTKDGLPAKRRLPPFDALGEAMTILHLDVEQDRAFVDAARDPQASGMIIASAVQEPEA